MRAAPRRRSHDDASGERRRRGRGTLARCVCSRYADFPLTPGDSAPQRYDSPLPSVVSSRNRTANQFQSLYSRQGWLVMFDDFWQNRASAKVTLDQREKKNIHSIYMFRCCIFEIANMIHGCFRESFQRYKHRKFNEKDDCQLIDVRPRLYRRYDLNPKKIARSNELFYICEIIRWYTDVQWINNYVRWRKQWSLNWSW